MKFKKYWEHHVHQHILLFPLSCLFLRVPNCQHPELEKKIYFSNISFLVPFYVPSMPIPLQFKEPLQTLHPSPNFPSPDKWNTVKKNEIRLIDDRMNEVQGKSINNMREIHRIIFVKTHISIHSYVLIGWCINIRRLKWKSWNDPSLPVSIEEFYNNVLQHLYNVLQCRSMSFTVFHCVILSFTVLYCLLLS